MRPLLVAALALALAPAAGCKPLVKAYLKGNPEVLEEIAYELQAERIAEAQKAAEARIPQYLEALERDPRDPVANPDGRITVVEFFDYRCGYCREAMPGLMTLIENNPDIRFVFKEMPILSEESRVAAAIALAARQKGADYLMIHQKFFASPALDGAEITRVVREEGLDPADLAQAASAEAIAKHLSDNRDLAAKLDIHGTPTFVVGGRIVQGSRIEALREAIERARRAA